MKPGKFNVLLAISLATSIIVLVSLVTSVIAKPVSPNPEKPWPSETVWGTRLRLENTYIGDAWFGAKTGSPVMSPPPPLPTDYMELVFVGGDYYMWVKSEVSAPQSYSWYVKLNRGGAAPENGTLSCEFENAEAWFVPPDFSVVLENSGNDIFVNLRRENGYIAGLPKYATLYVDNAVDVSISPSSRTGSPGDNVSFTVTVANTGRYDDTYSLGVDAGGWPYTIAPSSLSISAGNNATATLTVTLGADTKVIAVTADGAYAEDSTTCTAIALPPPGVDVSVSPSYQGGLPGSSLSYSVVVRNTGSVSGTYSLTVADNAGWFPNLLPTLLTVPAGENRTATLSVTVPNNAPENTCDNMTITATSAENTAVKDNASCTAQAIASIRRGVEVSISPDHQENENGGTLRYTVTIKNTGNVTEDYDLTVDDNAGWTLTLPSSVTDVIPEESRQVTLTVGIPSDAENDTLDNITITATSTENAAVSDSAACVAHCFVKPPSVRRGVQVSISEDSKSGKPGEKVTFTVTVTNTGTATDTFILATTDTEGWDPILSIPSTTLASGASKENIRLSITIPDSVSEGDSTTITVTAAGTGCENSATCTATTTEAPAPSEGISLLIYVGAAVVIIAAIVASILVIFKRR